MYHFYNKCLIIFLKRPDPRKVCVICPLFVTIHPFWTGISVFFLRNQKRGDSAATEFTAEFIPFLRIGLQNLFHLQKIMFLTLLPHSAEPEPMYFSVPLPQNLACLQHAVKCSSFGMESAIWLQPGAQHFVFCLLVLLRLACPWLLLSPQWGVSWNTLLGVWSVSWSQSWIPTCSQGEPEA